jgi:AraC-like DNA-binding protein
MRLERAQTLQVRVSEKSSLAVTEARFDYDHFGETGTRDPEDALALGLILRDVPACEIRSGKQTYSVGPSLAGDAFFFDLRELEGAACLHPFHWLFVRLPRTFLDALAAELGSSAISGFRGSPGAPVRNEILARFTRSVWNFAATHEEADELYADHLMLALTSYACGVHGDLTLPARAPAKLAGWQERVAKEVIDAYVAKGIGLRELAAHCGLGPSQLSHAFKRSVGMAPYQWLLKRRVEKAQSLLMQTGQSISEIAFTCGFADQSHFGRVFRGHTGTTPRRWRAEF